MMRFAPRTLFGRNAFLLALAIVLTATISTVTIFAFVLNTQLVRFTSIGADLVNTISDVAKTVDKDEWDRMVAEINANKDLQIRPDSQRPNTREQPAHFLQRYYIGQFVKQMETGEEVEWFIDETSVLWLNMPIGNAKYWVGVRIETMITPRSWLFGMLAIIGIVVTAFAILGSRAIAKPLAQLSLATDQLELGSDVEMSRIDGPREVAALAKSFQRMAARLKRAETVRSETLAALSHDLRTPLARLRLAVEMLEGDADLKESATRQVQDIDVLIGQFMDYARGGLMQEPEHFDLAFTLADLAAQYQVAFDGPDHLVFKGHRNAVRRAIINLLENALKYGEEPIALRVIPSDMGVVIEVHDKGPGFDPSLTREMLQSFRRGEDSGTVSGSGLGLAIVDQAARAHGGSITFEQLSPKGFVARLELRSAAGVQEAATQQ